MPEISKPFQFLLPVFAAALAFFISYHDFILWIQNGYYATTDADPIMRYVRVLELVQNGDWYNNTIQRDNYPHGIMLNWTRLFDLLILLPAYLLKLTFHFDWKEAIYWAGCWISPILQMGTVFILAWAIRPFRLNVYQLGLLLLLFVFHPMMQAYFSFGRGDHHSLLIGLYVLSFGSFLRLLGSLDSRKYMVLTSITLAVGLWASTEQLVMIFLCMAFLGLLWLQNVPNAGRCLFCLSSMLCLWTIVFILIEKPPHKFLIVEHDRISIVYLVIFFVASAISWINNRYVSCLSLRCRLAIVTFESIAAFLLLAFVFPRFYLGPYAAFDARILTVWANTLVEMQSIFHIVDMNSFILMVLGLIVSVSMMLFVVPRLRNESLSDQKNLHLFLLLLIGVYGILACIALRWCYYAIPAQLIGLVLVVLWLYQSTKKIQTYLFAALMGIGIILTFPGMWSLQNDSHSMKQYKSCNAMLNYMLQSGELEKIVNLKNKIVWTNSNTSPLFLYWTSAYTIGSNFTHNVEGIVDTMKLYTTNNDSKFKKLLKKRRADYLIACLYRDEAVKETVINKLALNENGEGLGLKLISYNMPEHPKAIQVTEKSKPRIYAVSKDDTM